MTLVDSIVLKTLRKPVSSKNSQSIKRLNEAEPTINSRRTAMKINSKKPIFLFIRVPLYLLIIFRKTVSRITYYREESR
jgi:hypothetical protein